MRAIVLGIVVVVVVVGLVAAINHQQRGEMTLPVHASAAAIVPPVSVPDPVQPSFIGKWMRTTGDITMEISEDGKGTISNRSFVWRPDGKGFKFELDNGHWGTDRVSGELWGKDQSGRDLLRITTNSSEIPEITFYRVE